MKPLREIVRLFAVICYFVFACAGSVLAHAIVVESIPKEGAVLSGQPGRILLRFNGTIEKSFAKVTLVRSDGQSYPVSVVTKAAGPDGAADRLLIALPRLLPGSYTARYQVLSTDGHVTEGLLRFSIR